mgnify:CR=1 FL=1
MRAPGRCDEGPSAGLACAATTRAHRLLSHDLWNELIEGYFHYYSHLAPDQTRRTPVPFEVLFWVSLFAPANIESAQPVGLGHGTGVV